LGASHERSPERPTASIPEVKALAGAIGSRFSALVELAAWCGLRRGELLALRRQEMDLELNVIRIERSMVFLRDGSIVIKEPKTAAGKRRVSIPPHLRESLERHMTAFVGPETDALVFTGDKGGPLRPNVLQAAWNDARRSIGRSDLHLHDLRHSSNTWAAATGAITAELMARMGHASAVAALRYQHATAGRDRAIGSALSALATTAAATASGVSDEAREKRAIEQAKPPWTKTQKDQRNTRLARQRRWQPQRDSNPCLHLERVMAHCKLPAQG